MYRIFIMSIFFLASLPNNPITAIEKTGGIALPASPITHMKIHHFEVIGFNLEKKLLAYKIIFGTTDRKRDVVEWGIADLKQSKMMAVEKSIDPKTSKKVFENFKSHMKNAGVKFAPLSITDESKISETLKAEIFVGEKALRAFRSLNNEARYELRNNFCPSFDPELSEATPSKSEMGLLILKDGKKVLWTDGYCPNQGGISLSLRGFISQANDFIALVDIKGEGTPQAAIKKKFEEIFVSPVFKKPAK